MSKRDHGTTALVLGISLLPHLGSRFITGWLYNSAGSSVLIAGLFHSMHNAIVNSTGLVAVVALPQFEVLVIMAKILACGRSCSHRSRSGSSANTGSLLALPLMAGPIPRKHLAATSSSCLALLVI